MRKLIKKMCLSGNEIVLHGNKDYNKRKRQCSVRSVVEGQRMYATRILLKVLMSCGRALQE